MKSLLFWFVRLFLKPVLAERIPVSIQRRWSAWVGLLLIGPRGFKVRRGVIAGTPTLQIDSAGSPSDRGVLYLHGGGYVLGGAGSHTKLAAHIGHATRARVWLPEYRLAPEHAYPAAVDDALAVYTALISAGQAPAKLTLAGDSAGAGLVLATALAIRDAGMPMPASLVLLSPWVDLSLGGESIVTRAKRDPMLSRSWLTWCADGYRGKASASLEGCSPLFANLQGLPPLLIQVGSEEVLLSDAERLAERARRAGVPVSLRRYDGLWHVFQFHVGMLREADASVAEIGRFVNRHWLSEAAVA